MSTPRTVARRLAGALSLSVLGFAALATGCAESQPEVPGAEILGFSADRVVVGQTLGLYGRQLLDADGTPSRLRFTGTYRTDDGRVEPVDLSVMPLADGQVERGGETFDVLKINRFGPFGVPFGASDRPGTFQGTVSLVSSGPDGVVRTATSQQALKLDVGPSVLIDQFEPLDAQCGAPALRAFPGVPYVMSVRPVGLKAVKFVYTLANVNGNPGLTVIEHRYDEPVGSDTLGVDELVVFNPIAEQAQAYVSVVRVVAYQADGQSAETALPMGVHRPVEVIYDGNREVAERYAPVPVSGCIPGSVNSRVTYSEARTEMRLRQVGITVSQDFSQSVGLGQSTELSEGFAVGESQSRSLGEARSESEVSEERYGVSYDESETNEVGLSTTDGESWSWNFRQGQDESEYQNRMNELYGDVSGSVTVGAEAEGSVPGFAKVSGSVETTVGARVGGGVGFGEGSTRSNSSSEGYSTGGSTSQSTSFGSATTEGRGTSFDEGYAVSRGNDRSVTDTRSLENTRTWDLSQGSSTEEVVQMGQGAAESLALVDSQSETVLTSYSSTIPRNAFGMFYRQTTRLVRRAEVRTFNQCGVARHAGELQFNEWTWAPDLALAPTCDAQPPKPNLPPAVCYIPPCGG